MLDVNVVVSATIGPLGSSRQLWLAFLAGQFTQISSDHVIATTIAKLPLPRIARGYGVTADDLDEIETLLRTRATVVPVQAEDITPVAARIDSVDIRFRFHLG